MEVTLIRPSVRTEAPSPWKGGRPACQKLMLLLLGSLKEGGFFACGRDKEQLGLLNGMLGEISLAHHMEHRRLFRAPGPWPGAFRAGGLVFQLHQGVKPAARPLLHRAVHLEHGEG